MRAVTPALPALLTVKGACNTKIGLRISPLNAAKLAAEKRAFASPLCFCRAWYTPSRYSLRLSK